MTNSIRKSLLRGLGSAAASGALIGAPVMAAPEAPVAAPITVAQGYGMTTTTPVEVIQVESVNGWYLTVGAGAVWPGNMNYWANQAPLRATSQPRGTLELNGGFSVDGGLGYDFGAIRTELTYGYSAPSVNSVVAHDLSRSFSAGGKINKNDIMLSAYWDVLPFSRFTPYIGGGIGYTNLSTPSFNVGNYYTGSNNKGLFGWQAKAGISYALAYNWDVYAEGTYSGTGNPQFEAVNFSSYQDVGAKLGFRYRFASPVVVVVPEPAPAPAPAPAPIP
ncbi:MAG: outer membrane beta-barrel protein, partial [Cyanobium sp. ELA507]